MSISDDWDFDYPNIVLQHIDGVLSYDTGAGRQAAVGEYVLGVVSGAIGKVIAVTGNTVSGTLTLTSVEGLFNAAELLEALSEVNFDAVTVGNGGFAVGDTIVDQVSGSIVVRAIEYNIDGVGGGTIFGDAFATFTNDSQLDISGGQVDVADADGVGINNNAALTTTLTNGTLAVPGTASENDSVIIHYDAGSQLIPEQAVVNDGSTAATGLVEQQYGVEVTGSIRLVDYDSTGGVFTDNNSLVIQQVVNYDNQVAGQVFSVGDVVTGSVSNATGRVIAVVDDGDSTGRIILADESGTWNAAAPDLIQIDVDGSPVTVAEVENTTFTLAAATINLPGGIRTEQRPTSVAGGVGQGGIYAAGDSLNIVRKLNSPYTFSQDTFDELVQLDDDEAMDAAFKGFAYSLAFGWLLQNRGENFLRKGALKDTGGAEVWSNPQTQGAQNKITDTAFLIDTTQTFRQPLLYIEQNAAKVVPWWIEGDIDVLLRTKTRQDTRFLDPTTPGLGQLIPGGDPSNGGFYTVFNREFYVSTYDATEVDGSGGVVNAVSMGTADDSAADRNPNGSHIIDYDAGSGATLLVGEEIVSAAGNGQRVGLVVAQTGGGGATGTVEYVLKSGIQFVNNDSLTGTVSGKTLDVDEPTSIGDVVAGFSVDIAYVAVDLAATPSGGTGITGTFIPGEPVTQAVTGATGRVVLANTTSDVLYLEVDDGSAAFAGDNDITGDTSGATWDAGTGATYPSATEFDADLNNGDGAQPYSGAACGDITGASPETMQNLYQYHKYLTRQEEETVFIEGPGTADVGTIGNLFRRLKDTYTEVKPGSPIGTFTGSMAFAQGWFLDTDFVDPADIRSFTVIDDNGISRSPPNLQSMILSGIDSGWRGAMFRSATPGSTVIQRTEFEVGAIGGGNNQAADTTILLAAQDRSVSPTPADVSSTGVLYILDPNDTGNFLQFPYSSVDRVTNIYTLASGDIGAVTGSVDLTLADNAHVAFFLEISAGTQISNTVQFVSDINLIGVARLKGFKNAKLTGTFTNTGANLGVSQQEDTIVDLP